MSRESVKRLKNGLENLIKEDDNTIDDSYFIAPKIKGL